MGHLPPIVRKSVGRYFVGLVEDTLSLIARVGRVRVVALREESLGCAFEVQLLLFGEL